MSVKQPGMVISRNYLMLEVVTIKLLDCLTAFLCLMLCAELQAVHTPELVTNVFHTAEEPCYFTSDTYSNAFTARAARLAAGACIDVAVAVASGSAPSGAAICRPPGHHAESSMAMGFCFFNNAVCIHASALIRHHDLSA